MRKFRFFMAALLSVSVLASGAALTACGGDDGEGGGSVKPIDEQTWESAFEELDYTNFSFQMSGILGETEEMYDIKISENAVYYKSQKNGFVHEFYSVKNENGTSITYGTQHAVEQNTYFIVDSYTTFERAVATVKVSIIKVSYESCYNAFMYNESNQEYVYDDVAKGSRTDRAPEEAGGYEYAFIFSCVDNHVKISEGKVASYSCKMNSVKYEDEFSTEEEEFSVECELEYTNIGTTVVTVPPEVIAEAEYNTYG